MELGNGVYCLHLLLQFACRNIKPKNQIFYSCVLVNPLNKPNRRNRLLKQIHFNGKKFCGLIV